MVSKEDLGIVSSQTAMCFGHEELPSCRWWRVFCPPSALTGGPRSPVVAWGTGPSQPSSDAFYAVASLDELIPRDSSLSLKVHSSLEARRYWSWWTVSDRPLTMVSIWCVCSRSAPVFGCVFFGDEGGGGLNSAPRSPCLQEVP